MLTEGRIFEVAQAYVWLVGSVNGRGWEHVWPLAATLALLLPVLLALGRRARRARRSATTLARSLGLGVERSRLALLAAAVVLTGVAVSAAGPIGFVAFVAPHIARRLGRAGLAAGRCCRSPPAAAPCSCSSPTSPAGCCSRRPRSRSGSSPSIVAAPYFLCCCGARTASGRPDDRAAARRAA